MCAFTKNNDLFAKVRISLIKAYCRLDSFCNKWFSSVTCLSACIIDKSVGAARSFMGSSIKELLPCCHSMDTCVSCTLLVTFLIHYLYISTISPGAQVPVLKTLKNIFHLLLLSSVL